MNTVELFDLGRQRYQPTWELQTAIQQRLVCEKKARQQDESSCASHDVFLFVEHPHVYTLGKSGDDAHLLKSMQQLDDLEVEYVETDRGGDITYHGPGQIVGYPILDLDRHFTDIHKYMRCLEEIIIRTCGEYGIEAGRIKGLTGVWVDDAKICAMGVRCSRWVTMHGFALNVNTDLSYFNHIIPCGIADKNVTSLQKILGISVDVKEVKNHTVTHFQDVFGVKINEGHSISELNNEFSYLSGSSKQAVSQ